MDAAGYMGTVRQSHASAAVGGKLYVFGGYGAGAGVSARRRSTTLLRAATPLTNLTSARSYLVAIASKR